MDLTERGPRRKLKTIDFSKLSAGEDPETETRQEKINTGRAQVEKDITELSTGTLIERRSKRAITCGSLDGLVEIHFHRYTSSKTWCPALYVLATPLYLLLGPITTYIVWPIYARPSIFVLMVRAKGMARSCLFKTLL